MKTFILIVLSTLLNTNSCNAQHITNQITKNDTTMIQKYGQIEEYDFTATENGTRDVIVEKNGWVIMKGKISNKVAQYVEYAPASQFYILWKHFHPNGMIWRRCQQFGATRFALYEEFDEQGNLVKLVDEDKKFGKIKPIDIVELLEKEGWFNRETGENKIISESPLPTNGYFTMKLMGNFNIMFAPAKIENGVEVEPPQWLVSFIRQSQFYFTKALYRINGNTGEFTKVIDDTKIYDEY